MLPKRVSAQLFILFMNCFLSKWNLWLGLMTKAIGTLPWLADELNAFQLRCDKNHDFTDTLITLKDNTQAPSALAVDIRSVEKHFRLTKSRKSPGPYDICSQVLKTCAEQLCIFHFIFTLSPQQKRVPKLWKHSTIVHNHFLRLKPLRH